jgi:exportin-1
MQFSLFMDSILWAIKHTTRDIADTGLNCELPSLFMALSLIRTIVCLELVNNFIAATDPSITNAFFRQYYLRITQDILFVLTDSDHKSGFKLQSVLLSRMFQLVEMNHIQVPLFDPSQVPNPNISNAIYAKEFCANLLKQAFPHMQG